MIIYLYLEKIILSNLTLHQLKLSKIIFKENLHLKLIIA